MPFLLFLALAALQTNAINQPYQSAEQVAHLFAKTLNGKVAAYFLQMMGLRTDGRADQKRLRVEQALVGMWDADRSVKEFLQTICPACELTGGVSATELEEAGWA